MASLSSNQLQRLLQFAAAEAMKNPLGYMDTNTDKSLVRRGLISVVEKRMSLGGSGAIGRMVMTVKIAELTAAGHRYIGECGFAPFPNEEKFLGNKRVGYCVPTFAPYISCLAKGWIEQVEVIDTWVKWKKTKLGRSAMKIIRTSGEQDLIDSVK